MREYQDVLSEVGFEGFELDAERIMTARKPVS